MIRLFVSDIDGTLVNDKGILEEETVEAVRRFQAQGGIFMLATGRNDWDINEITSRIPDTVNNCSSGCVLYGRDGRPLISCFLEEEVLKQIMADESLRAGVVLYQGQTRSRLSQTREEALARTLENMTPDIDREKALELFGYLYQSERVSFACAGEEILSEAVTKIEMLFLSRRQQQALIQKLRKLFPQCNIVDGGYFNNVEVSTGDSDKGLAILKFCRLHGIKEDEVAVAGDSENDVSMLKLFKNSYAMKNGSPEAKKAANHLAEDNAHLGLARLLQEICDKNEAEIEKRPQ